MADGTQVAPHEEVTPVVFTAATPSADDAGAPLITQEARQPALTDGFDTPAAGFLQQRTPREIVVAVALIVVIVGQVLIWIKNGILDTDTVPAKHPCDVQTQGTKDQVGVYALLLCVIAFANFRSLTSQNHQLMWVSAAVAFSILDVNVCETHWLMKCTPGPQTSDNDANVIKAGYVMLLTGCLLTFVAFPVQRISVAGEGQDKLSRPIGLFLVVLLLVGSVLLWAKGSPCSSDRNVGSSSDNPKYPIYVGRAAYLGVWHLISMVSSGGFGTDLSFFYAAVSIADYQPFGPRCDWNECKAGTSLIFIALILMVLDRIRSEHAQPVEKQPVRREKLIWHGVCCVVAIVGGIAIWATKDKELSKGYIGQQEVWDTVSMVLASVLMLVCTLTGRGVYATVAMALSWSVINRTLGATEKSPLGFGSCPPEWSEDTGINIHSASGIRAGYIMVFIALGGSILAMLNHGTLRLMMPDLGEGVAKDEKRFSSIVGIILILCVTYLWSTKRFYGQLGFTALLYMISTVSGPCGETVWGEGLDLVYFTVLLQIPSLTPFTTCESAESANKLVLLLCLMCLLGIVYQHVSRGKMPASARQSYEGGRGALFGSPAE
eukprot:TRINITY_DN5236_c0_g1_i4.p1 TRINITY_DN5236_c0_g1~~TRINITY_DN5236_c0_g1_i4.p1  ORF type:complete len:605 (+),score=204.29 TRINITY_DN5236_c0_g1_i4:69-1883(+)